MAESAPHITPNFSFIFRETGRAERQRERARNSCGYYGRLSRLRPIETIGPNELTKCPRNNYHRFLAPSPLMDPCGREGKRARVRDTNYHVSYVARTRRRRTRLSFARETTPPPPPPQSVSRCVRFVCNEVSGEHYPRVRRNTSRPRAFVNYSLICMSVSCRFFAAALPPPPPPRSG